MNDEHLRLCSSAEWAETVRTWIIPWVLDGVDLGEDVLEVGPGPGSTTDVLRTSVPRLTAVEIDAELADALAARLAGTNVEVLCADATATGLPEGRFSGAACLSMLHHIPGVDSQDRLLAEVARVLRDGGVLVGEDSLDSPESRALHVDDTYVPLDPDRLADRLVAAGFRAVEVTTDEYAVRFRARKPRRSDH
ncbi:class I SAM-dependent methyltransferase [Tsukamurella soli]|uniref:Class I SAM-dependent methyltransferase n=1 Tax=Tsukamurella soli TaxID=644556 RepID=A0ABP8KGU3_9ACTN